MRKKLLQTLRKVTLPLIAITKIPQKWKMRNLCSPCVISTIASLRNEFCSILLFVKPLRKHSLIWLWVKGLILGDGVVREPTSALVWMWLPMVFWTNIKVPIAVISIRLFPSMQAIFGRKPTTISV